MLTEKIIQQKIDLTDPTHLGQDHTWENGQRVKIVQPEYPGDEEPDDAVSLNKAEIRRIQSEAIVRFIQFICPENASVKEAGRTLVLTAHTTVYRSKNQTELAELLEVSQSRVSQLITAANAISANVFHGLN